MEDLLVKSGRRAYGICVAACGIQQLFYADFNPVFLPGSSSWLPGNAVLSYVMSAFLIGTGLLIVFAQNARMTTLWLGFVFLALFLFCQIPYHLFFDPYGKILGAWTRALKELAFSGAAFAVAGSYPPGGATDSAVTRGLSRLIPFGRIFFSITMITFGIDHFLYDTFVATLVPAWIPYPMFWTYFAGVALIAAGVAIIIQVKLKTAALLLGTMIFLWLIVLHIPRAFADFYGENGNELTSVFQALGFSGAAFVMAYGYRKSTS